MSTKRSLRTLDEWNMEVALGGVIEPLYSIRIVLNGIECPNPTNVRGGLCRSHLFDLPFYKRVEGEIQRQVACYTCGWSGTRRIARIKIGNGRIKE